METTPDFAARVEQAPPAVDDATFPAQSETPDVDAFESQIAAMRAGLRIQYPGSDDLTIEGMVFDRLCEMRRHDPELHPI